MALRCVPRVLGVLVLAVWWPCVSGQQANSTTALLRINGVETLAGPMSVIADPCTGLDFRVGSGPHPFAPFILAYGDVATGYATVPGMGIVDLDAGGPAFHFVMDGIWSGAFGGVLGGTPALNSIARTNATGNFVVSISVLGSPPGAWGGFQAAVVDPTSTSGVRLSAATRVTIVNGVSYGNVAPSPDGAVTIPFGAGFVFPFYGQSYTSVNIAENGLLGFGGLASLQGIAGVPPGQSEPATNSGSFLGIGGIPCPPVLGFFEDLRLAANGGAGSIIHSQTAGQFNITWCGAEVRGTAARSSFTISLFGPTSGAPGRIELAVTEASTGTAGRGRVLGLSPGGTGSVSASSTLTGVNLSAVSRNILAGGANAGYTATASDAAVFESFNSSWSGEPVQPVFDLGNVILRFNPEGPGPGAGPYRVTAQSEAPLALTGVNPTNSPATGGGTVTISGTGFRHDGTVGATIGSGSVAALTYLDSETLTGIIPSAPGPQVASVTVSVGSLPALATLLNAFTYAANPGINGTLPLLDEEFATYTFSPSLFGAFDLYGVGWTRMFVHANGHAHFASSPPASTSNNFVSEPPQWNGFAAAVIAPLFNDLCGDVMGCSPFTGTPSVTTAETAGSVTVRWNQWAQWPNLNPGLTLSFTLDKSLHPGQAAGPNRILFDYSQSGVAPNPNVSQPGGTTGIIVGLKPPGVSTASPTNLIAASGGALGVPGPNLGPDANLFHWIRSMGHTGPVPSSTPGWPFGSAATPGPLGNRSIEFRSVDAANNNFSITLH